MNKFIISSDEIDPKQVPQKNLYTGAQIPAIGLGTFGSDRFRGEQVAEAVEGAISAGYRHIDCAAVYGNEHLIGKVLNDVMQSGIKRANIDPRESLFGVPKEFGSTRAHLTIKIALANYIAKGMNICKTEAKKDSSS